MSKRTSAALFAATVMLVAGSSVLAFQPERPAGQPGQSGQPGEPGQPGQGARGGRGGPGGRGGNMQIPVGQAMNIMNRSARQLGEQIGDAAKKEENLRLVNAMQMGCVAAKGQPVPPEITEGLADEAAKSELAAEYHKELLKSLRLMIDLEQAIMDGKADEAKATLDAIVKLRDHAHDEMGMKGED